MKNAYEAPEIYIEEYELENAGNFCNASVIDPIPVVGPPEGVVESEIVKKSKR